MKPFTSVFLLAVMLVQFSGCASIISGKRQDVFVNTAPSGATVLVNGVDYGVTPVTLELRRKDRHEIVFEKAGYRPKTQWLQRKLNGWVFGNIILGGIIGILIDHATGARHKIEPKHIDVDLLKN